MKPAIQNSAASIGGKKPTTMKNISIKCKGIYMSEESICNQCSNCRWLDTSGEDNPPSEATPLRCDNYRTCSHLD